MRATRPSGAALGLRVAFALAATVGGLFGTWTEARPHPGPNPHRYELADYARGEYLGAITSDVSGALRADVHVTVSKIAPSTVRVSSVDPRLPASTFNLQRVRLTLRNTGGPGVFRLDLNKVPHSLDLTVGGISWSGVVVH